MAQIDGVLVGINVVILVVGVALWLRTDKASLVRSQHATQQQQKAWQWWYHKQQQQQHHQAEIVRDGLLQDAFALRRHLEKGKQDSHISYLEQFNQFYQTLETLSNQLSPPFIEDSLPLALQFLMKQRTNIDTPFEIDADTDWSSESVESNQIVMSVVGELLPLLLKDAQSPFNVHLWQDSLANQLQFTRSVGNYQTDLSILQAAEVQYLKEIFRSLISGTLDINQKDTQLICQLSWPKATPNP